MISRQDAKTKYKKTPRLCGLADLGPLAKNLRIERRNDYRATAQNSPRRSAAWRLRVVSLRLCVKQ
jgi:hypothetical protein